MVKETLPVRSLFKPLLPSGRGTPQLLGGFARAAALPEERRKEIASTAAKVRWGKEPRSTRGAVKGRLIGVRLQPDLLARLDKHRGGQTRPEAIRRLVEKELGDG